MNIQEFALLWTELKLSRFGQLQGEYKNGTLVKARNRDDELV